MTPEEAQGAAAKVIDMIIQLDPMVQDIVIDILMQTKAQEEATMQQEAPQSPERMPDFNI